MKAVMSAVENKPFQVHFKTVLDEKKFGGKYDSNLSEMVRGYSEEAQSTIFDWNMLGDVAADLPKLEFVASLDELKSSMVQICLWENLRETAISPIELAKSMSTQAPARALSLFPTSSAEKHSNEDLSTS